ncbi:hypothetical protein Psuf_070760 [Phytohabitans suffuscus]|uniref:Uncharacterized protein n=1 Tax=Phytohabitans suffuscus TaxID=624315 RepID=A0A6F8YUV1_9ACTN|nr:hypothetical protein Psuf_070760 [Phytohabitans suffuscus]
MSYVAGPSIGGVLVQVLTAPVALVADVLTYLTSAVFLTRMKVTEHPARDGPGGGMAAGVRYVARSAVLRAILLGAAVTGPVTRRIGIGPAVILGLVVFPAPLVLVPLAGDRGRWCSRCCSPPSSSPRWASRSWTSRPDRCRSRPHR